MTPELQGQIEHAHKLMEGAGWCSLDKANRLASLIVDNKLKSIVEIGVFAGKSLIPMAMAARSIGTHVYGIDPWETAAAIEGTVGKENEEWWKNINQEEIYVQFIHWVLRFQLAKECRWLRMRSEDARLMFPSRSIDLLHLDSNHSEEVSCRDVGLWGSTIKYDGFLVLDDSNWTTQRKAMELLGSMFSYVGEYGNDSEGMHAVFKKIQ